MKIGIVGCGVVGGAVRDGMERLGHDIKVHDIVLNTKLEDLLDREIIFVCVPTPQNKNGSCDISIVEEVVLDLAMDKYNGIVAIKSTVEPGTTDSLIDDCRNLAEMNIAFVPEFLREKSAFYDFTEGHDTCIIGAKSHTTYSFIKEAHGHYPQKFVKLSPTEAELTKYFSNTFNALRIIFANGFYDLCQKLDADYTKIKNAVVSRPTMTDLYLDCNENFRGFAGVCLPKDTAAIAHLAKIINVKAKIFETIVEDNKLYKPTVFDGMRME